MPKKKVTKVKKAKPGWVECPHICLQVVVSCCPGMATSKLNMARFDSQERQKGRQAGVETGQGVGHGEGQGQRCPVGAEAAGHRPVPRPVPGVMPEVVACERGAHHPAVPRGEGHHRCDWVSEETGRSQRGEGQRQVVSERAPASTRP